ncbi:ABC transporter family protein isoform X2 [Carex rostrata]
MLISTASCAAPFPPFFPAIAAASSARGSLTDSPAIESRNVSYSITNRRGKFLPILKNCSISVPHGQLWMLLGPNGCGKSTFLKVLAGLLNPTEGKVHVNGSCSFVFQNPDHQRPIQTLSGGQKQRVAIAGALAEACKVLLLDELTTFLDEYDQMGVVNAVKNCVAGPGDVAALWVTHRLEELKYADGAIYMEDGRIMIHGDASSVAKFLKDKQSEYIKHYNF